MTPYHRLFDSSHLRWCNPYLMCNILSFFIHLHVFQMDVSSSDSDLDIPLDQLPEYDAALADDFHQWSLKNSGQALGTNHRIEMSKNFGIAKNRQRQREEEYKSVIKNKDKNKSKSIKSKPKTQKITEPYQRVVTKREADQSSDEEIQVKKKRSISGSTSGRKKNDDEVFNVEDEVKKEANGIENQNEVQNGSKKEGRKRKVSDKKSESEKSQRERTKSNSSNRPAKMNDRDNRTSSLPTPGYAERTDEDVDNGRRRAEQQIERQKKAQEQIAKNKKRKGFKDFYLMATH